MIDFNEVKPVAAGVRISFFDNFGINICLYLKLIIIVQMMRRTILSLYNKLWAFPIIHTFFVLLSKFLTPLVGIDCVQYKWIVYAFQLKNVEKLLPCWFVIHSLSMIPYILRRFNSG